MLREINELSLITGEVNQCIGEKKSANSRICYSIFGKKKKNRGWGGVFTRNKRLIIFKDI